MVIINLAPPYGSSTVNTTNVQDIGTDVPECVMVYPHYCTIFYDDCLELTRVPTSDGAVCAVAYHASRTYVVRLPPMRYDIALQAYKRQGTCDHVRVYITELT